LETRMNCGSLFVGVRGGTMEASHPDIARGVSDGEAAKGELAVEPFDAPHSRGSTSDQQAVF
ncbi:MAG: hypothetical protein WB628_03460, partial [Candidatus Sulfotelmatobacter sp.]